MLNSSMTNIPKTRESVMDTISYVSSPAWFSVHSSM